MAKKKVDVVELPVASIVVSHEYQAREAVNDDVVTEYVDVLKAGAKDQVAWPFSSPVDIVVVDGEHILVDGFTRVEACKRAKVKTVLARVVAGTKSDAMKAACSANVNHGQRRTPSDKRRAVIMAFKEFPKLSATEIGKICLVSHTFVSAMKKEHGVSTAEVVTKSGVVLKSPGKKNNPTKTVEGTVASGDAVAKDEPCPNCGLNAWVFRDDGDICSGCMHPYGEPAGDEDEQKKVSAPATLPVEVKNEKAEVKAMRSAFGKFVRAVDEAKCGEALGGPLHEIAKYLGSL